MEENKKKTSKGMIIGVAALVVLIAALLIAWVVNRPQAASGSKSITLQVVDDQGATTDYSVKTDAEYLRQVFSEIKGLTVEGDEDEYGLYVKSVNGIHADYFEDGAYWGFYVNGDYCTEGVDTQPVYDGDAFEIRYELAE